MKRPSTDIKMLSQILTDIIDIRDNEQRELAKTVDELIHEWISLSAKIADNNRVYGNGFSPLGKLRISETQHSRLLGDLLNPSGDHAQGDLFLRPFLEYLEVPEPENGKWYVSVETGRVDILLWRDRPVRSAIIIENKSNDAGDRPNQIYRYWHHNIYLWKRSIWDSTDLHIKSSRSKCYHLIYLPTDGGKTPALHSLERPKGWETINPHERVPLNCKTVSLSHLMRIWEDKAFPRISPNNVRLQVFFKLYQEPWKT